MRPRRVYGIAEMAKANNLKPYEYLQRLLRLTKLLAAIMVASSFVKVPIIYRLLGNETEMLPGQIMLLNVFCSPPVHMANCA